MLWPLTTPLDAPARRPGGVYTETVFDLDFFADLVSGGRSNLIGVIPARFRFSSTSVFVSSLGDVRVDACGVFDGDFQDNVIELLKEGGL